MRHLSRAVARLAPCGAQPLDIYEREVEEVATRWRGRRIGHRSSLSAGLAKPRAEQRGIAAKILFDIHDAFSWPLDPQERQCPFLAGDDGV